MQRFANTAITKDQPSVTGIPFIDAIIAGTPKRNQNIGEIVKPIDKRPAVSGDDEDVQRPIDVVKAPRRKSTINPVVWYALGALAVWFLFSKRGK